MRSTDTEGFVREFGVLVRAGVGVVMVHTREPHRTHDVLREYAFSVQKSFKVWDAVYGWRHYPDNPAEKITVDKILDVYAAMKRIADLDNNGEAEWSGDDDNGGVFVMHYPHWTMGKHPGIIQCLKHYVRAFATTKQRLVLLVPEGFTPPLELQNDITIMDFPLPSPGELREALVKIIGDGLADGYSGDVFAEEEVDTLVSNAQGMTKLESENAFSEAIITNADTWPDTPFVDFNRVLLECKTDVVKRSEVLELMEAANFDEVGGLDLFKEYVSQRTRAFTEEAREFGVDVPKGVMLIGPPGCLYGTTRMRYKRGQRNSGQEITLESLYRKFNGIGAGKPWDTTLPTLLQSFDVETGRVVYNRVVDVTCSGIKKLYHLHTEGGRSLVLTGNHPVLTSRRGYVPASELTVEDGLVVRGSMLPRAGSVRQGRMKRVVVEGLLYYPSGWSKTITEPTTGKEYHYQRQHRARLVVEAHINRMSYPELVRRLREDPTWCRGMEVIRSGFIVHHLDNNPLNDTLTNLCVMPKAEHDALHTDEYNFNTEYTTLDTVRSVVACGSGNTYDVQMEDPLNNFSTADGILVHNTGKSLCAKAVSSALGLPLIKFDVSRVFGSLVGQSEERVRAALSQLDAMAPCVSGDTQITVGMFGQTMTAKELHIAYAKPKSIPTVDERGKLKTTLLLGTLCRGAKKTLIITDEEGNTITVTHNHKLLVLGGDGVTVWKQAADLEVGGGLVRAEEIKTTKIVSIEDGPVTEVYDLCCGEEAHTYVSNGFVSHNCVALIDEVDKGLGGAQHSGGDSGVSRRVLGNILTHMQESTAPVYWMFTANRAESLDPALIRKGRLDEVFCMTLPNIVERMEIMRIHLLKRKQDPKKIKDLAKAIKESKGYVGSEIEAAVAEAVNQAFHSKGKVTGKLISEQLGFMKPISEAFKEDFDAMMEWAENNARLTSTEKEDPVAIASIITNEAGPTPRRRRLDTSKGGAK